MNEEIRRHLGPLAPLAGTWEGEKGQDVAPADDRGTEHNAFRERITFEPCGPVENHEQVLYLLRYATTAWRIGEEDPFHEETGYWLWDANAKLVMRAFIVPRGVTVLAGGPAEPDARSFRMAADVGSETFGICSNPFLDEEFKTVRYELEVTIHDDGSFTYAEDTQLRMKGKADLFHHTDANTLRRI